MKAVGVAASDGAKSEQVSQTFSVAGADKKMIVNIRSPANMKLIFADRTLRLNALVTDCSQTEAEKKEERRRRRQKRKSEKKSKRKRRQAQGGNNRNRTRESADNRFRVSQG